MDSVFLDSAYLDSAFLDNVLDDKASDSERYERVAATILFAGSAICNFPLMSTTEQTQIRLQLKGRFRYNIPAKVANLIHAMRVAYPPSPSRCLN